MPLFPHGEGVAIRIAYLAGAGAIVLTVVLVLAVAVVRAVVDARARTAARAVNRWRPVFTASLAGVRASLDQPGRSARVPVLILWNHLVESLRGPARTSLIETARASELDQVARSMLRSRDDGRRLIAVVTLGNLEDAERWDDLRSAARGEHPSLAFAATRAMLRIDPARTIDDLAPTLTMRSDWHAARVTSLLTQAEPSGVAAAVTEVAKHAPQASLPRLVRLLVATQDRSILPYVRSLMAAPADAELAAAGVYALGEMQDPADARIVRSFTDHPAWFVRTQVAIALGRLGTRQDADLLVSMLDDEEWWVRYRAAEALAGMHGLRDRLERLRSEHPSPHAREIVTHALAERDLS